MMKKTLVTCGIVGALLGITGAARGQENVTIKGEIVDMACYLSKGERGPAHKSCAQMCAKQGTPIGVLTDKGELFLVIDDHDNPEPYDQAKKLAGGNAELTGKKHVRNGVPGIVVSSAKGL